MSKFHQFLFKQYQKIHVFCLLMLIVFQIFRRISMSPILWFAAFLSIFANFIYFAINPRKINRYIYSIMAISSCISLSIIASRFLWVALMIDLRNMTIFFVSMFLFALITAIVTKFFPSRKKSSWTTDKLIKRLKWFGWGMLTFLFFYQVILSYLLRPNFLTVMSLSISHLNLITLIWTYFDIKRLFSDSGEQAKLKHVI